MTPEEAQESISSIRLAVLFCQQSISLEQLERVLQQRNTEQAIMPLIDPTAYIRHRARMEEQGEVLHAFAQFRRAIEGKVL